MTLMQRVENGVGGLAALVFVLAVVGFGLSLPGYQQWVHPVALLGAIGIAHGTAFSWLGFVLPGLLALVVSLRLLARLPMTGAWTLRVGGQLTLLAALAFAAMGVFALDANDVDNRSSQYHATAWMLWVVAFVPGALLLAHGAWRNPRWRGLMLLCAVCGVWVGVAALGLNALLPAPVTQRLAFAGWLLWLAVVLPLARPVRG